MPTLEGGLRIEAQNVVDWALLESISKDACGDDNDLASRLGALMGEDPHAADWEEFVVPDLRHDFAEQLQFVDTAIAKARSKSTAADGFYGHLWIHRPDAGHWYGALNQARLAIEARHHFGPRASFKPEEFDDQKRSAFFRSQFYQAVQSLLLDFVIK